MTASPGGASGFIAGRSMWKEAVGMDRQARQAYLADERKQRLDNLVQMMDGRARPYTEVTKQ